MRKYVIAWISYYDNELILDIIIGEDEVSAFKNWAINGLSGGKYKNDIDWCNWINGLGLTIEDCITTLYDSDVDMKIKELD